MLLITKCNCLKKYKLRVFVRPCSSIHILLEHDMRFGNKKRLHSFKEINAKVWLQIQRSKSLFTFKHQILLLNILFGCYSNWVRIYLITSYMYHISGVKHSNPNPSNKSKINQSRVGL